MVTAGPGQPFYLRRCPRGIPLPPGYLVGKADQVGQALAHLVKQSDAYAGEFEGELFMYQSRTHPRTPGQVAARQILKAQADDYNRRRGEYPEDLRVVLDTGIGLADEPEALNGFLTTLRAEQSEWTTTEETEQEPAEPIVRRDDPGLWWVDFGAN